MDDAELASDVGRHSPSWVAVSVTVTIVGTLMGTKLGTKMGGCATSAAARAGTRSGWRRWVSAWRPSAWFGLAALAVLVAVAPHGVVDATTENQITLVSSEPAAGAVLSAAPTAIVLQFDREVPLAVEDTGTLTCAGNLIVTGDGEYATDRTKLTYPITGTIGRGTCIFSYQLVDGAGAEVGSAILPFSVETGAVTSAPAARSTTTAPAAPTGPTTTVPAAAAATTAPAAATGTTAQAEASAGSDPGLGLGLVVFAAAILILFGALVVIMIRARRRAAPR